MPLSSKQPNADHPLLIAARFLDSGSSEGVRLTTRLIDLGIEPNALLWLSEQRAIRHILLRAGRLDEANIGIDEKTPVELNEEQREELVYLTALYVEAISIGWKARLIEESKP